MQTYKGYPYEVILQPLQDDLGFEGYGIVWVGAPGEMAARQVPPPAPTFNDEEQARRAIEQAVKGFIDKKLA